MLKSWHAGLLQTRCGLISRGLVAGVMARARRVAILSLAAMAMMNAPAFALPAAGWQIVDRQGTILSLDRDQWNYLPQEAQLEQGVAIRTLKKSKLTLQYQGYVLELQPNTTVRIEVPVKNAAVVTQFAGVLTVRARPSSKQRLRINTREMAVYVTPGNTSLTVRSDTGQIDVAEGAVVVLDAKTETETTIGAGETFTAANGAEVPGKGKGVGKGNGNANAGGNGNGNGGGNGNGNAGGNGNGNAGGNGNGNAGGNGNNGNGNGASNSNGNGAGNNAAGGNGSGNNNGRGNRSSGG